MSAIATSHRVRVSGYIAGNGDEADTVLLCPLRIFFRERGIYLFGLRENQSGDTPIKVNALERFGSVRELAECFAYPVVLPMSILTNVAETLTKLESELGINLMQFGLLFESRSLFRLRNKG